MKLTMKTMVYLMKFQKMLESMDALRDVILKEVHMALANTRQLQTTIRIESCNATMIAISY